VLPKSIQFSVTRLLLAALALIVLSSSVSADTSIDDKLASSAQYIVARSNLFAQNSYGLIYDALRLKEAFDSATQRKLTDAATQQLLNQTAIDAASYVDSISFAILALNNRQKIISQSVDNASTATLQTLSPTDLESFLQGEIETLAVPDAFPRELNEQDLLTTALWIYDIASTPSHPLQSYFASAIQKYHNVTVAGNAIFDSTTPNLSKVDALSAYFGQIKLTSGTAGIHTEGDFNTATAAATTSLNTQATDAASAMSEPDEQTRTAKEKNLAKTNLTGPFGAASAIADLLGDHNDAKTLSEMEKLTGTIDDIVTSDISFALYPFAVVTPYLAAAVLVVDLIAGSQGDNPNKAVLAQLQQIEKQIEQLRQLINTRFDEVDYKLDVNFSNIEATLNTIRSDQQITLTELNAVQSALEQLVLYDRAAFQAIGNYLAISGYFGCFPTDSSSLTQDVFKECWTTYLELSAGKFSTIVNTADTADTSIRLSTAAAATNSQYAAAVANATDYPNFLAATLAATYGQPESNLLNYSQFLWGAFYLKKLQDVHPEWAAAARQTPPPPIPGAVVFADVADGARTLEQFLLGMAVDPNGGLRLKLFTSLFESYENAVLDEWTASKTALESSRSDTMFNQLKALTWPKGPNLLDFDDSDTPAEVTNLAFAQKPLQTALGAEGPYDAPTWMAMCPGSQVMEQVGGKSVPLPFGTDAPMFRFDPEIFNQVSSGVMRWALLDGLFGAKLSGCMKQATISNVILGQGDQPGRGIPVVYRGPIPSKWHGMTADGDFQINLYFSYSPLSQVTGRPIMVGIPAPMIALPSLKEHYSFARADSGCAVTQGEQTSNIKMYAMALWNGGYVLACDGTNLGIPGPTGNSNNSNVGSLQFTQIPLSPGEQQQFNDTVESLTALYQAKGSEVLTQAQQKVITSSTQKFTDIETYRTALHYGLVKGIGGNGVALQNITNWVADPMNMPDGPSWVAAFFAQLASVDAVNKEMKSRDTTFGSLLDALDSEHLSPGYDVLREPVKFMIGANAAQ
jgi:hypothetical protein